MTTHYILADRRPVPEPDVLTWAQWYRQHNRHVARTNLTQTLDVSTIFLGLDHNFGSRGRPILFETMVFDTSEHPSDWHEYQERYSTWEDAEAGHKRIVTAIQEGATP